jgi:excisionase family DNA binding protein
MERLLTPREVAQLLGVKVDTLRIWRARNCGPSYCKLGRLCRYQSSAVESFVKNGFHRTKVTEKDCQDAVTGTCDPPT